MPGSFPTISVIMPVYNAGRYAGEAIESILNQTFGDFEFIIIDDCSTDDSAAVVRSYAARDPRIVFLQNTQNQGAAQTRNRGLDAARGQFIAFMDSDDLCAPERFEKQLDFLRKNPDIDLCGTYYMAFYESDGHREKLPAPEIHAKIIVQMLFGNPFALPSVMMRREAFEATGVRFKNCVAEDFLFWVELSARLTMANLPEFLFFYRRWDQQTSTRDIGRQTLSAQAILQAHLRDALDIRLSDEQARIFTCFSLGHDPSLGRPELKTFAGILRDIYRQNKRLKYCDDRFLRIMITRRYKKACLRFYPLLLVKLQKRVFAHGL